MRTLVLLNALLAAVAAPLAGQSAQPTAAFRLPDADMISEDIAYDSTGDRFFVSSVHRGGINVVARQARAVSSPRSLRRTATPGRSPSA